jgi:hypothetical protein
MLRLFLVLVVAVAALIPTASAHVSVATGKRVLAPAAPAPGAEDEIVGGTLEALPILDTRNGISVVYYALRQSDGTRIAVKWLGSDHASPGATVRLEGKRNGNTFFVERSAVIARSQSAAAPSLPASAKRFRGTLELLYADLHDGGLQRVYALKDANGEHVALSFAAAPDILEPGMALAIDAVPAGDGVSVEARAIEILEGAAATKQMLDEAAISGTTQVLVVLMKFTDTATEPFTQASIQSTMFTGAQSVAGFYRETSYQKHQLAGVVTPWLRARFAALATCDFNRIQTEANYLAQQAGYNPVSYQRVVYVFPRLTACGWWGLGGGSRAWINGQPQVLVFAHELGHTFGLDHASSLDCGAAVIGGACTRSEYGDAYSVMGAARAAHFTAVHKQQLGYFSAGQVKTHAGGTVTYTLSPMEVAGGSTYAVVVPASATRHYWIEWRQPIGYDAALTSGVTSGALLHVGAPSDYSCDSCLLDMTPVTTTGFADGALPVGQTYFDATTNTAITVLGMTATTLTVQVSIGPRGTFVDVPTTHSGYSAIEALVYNGITLGCATSPARFCPEQAVTRAEMAVFIERVKRGAAFSPTGTGAIFADVAATYWAAGFIEQLYTDGITTGCASSPLRYCPTANITRAQMAPMLIKARYGSTFNPGAATGTLFADVPASHPFAAWIERLYQYGITLGCTGTPRNYCPNASVTRAQMAMFLVRAFGLPLAP